MKSFQSNRDITFSELAAISFSSLQRSWRVIFVEVALLTVVIAVLDWRVDAEVPLGFLYLLPMVLASRICNSYLIIFLGAFYMGLTELFDNFQWSPHSGISRDLLYFAAFAGIGLFNHSIAVSRLLSAANVLALEQENKARREAEEQLQVLVESSPVAILTMDAAGKILLVNEAAHRLFDVHPGGLKDKPISPYLPALVNVPALRAGQQMFRTIMQCKGYRSDGEVFAADVWFSTYRTSAGARLAAMVIDSSEELRDREEAGLHQLLASSRILVAAVSHEIRNVCGAIAIVHQNLSRCEHLEDDKDFEALGTLVLALENIASMDLRQSADQASTVNVKSFLEELRIIIGPSMREQGILVDWTVPSHLPSVYADKHSLMQVFLNLTKNSERAVLAVAQPRIHINAEDMDGHVSISVIDNGGGIKNPDEIFRPFQQHAQATGLGLYLSRALMRSFGGDLHYTACLDGAVFIVEFARSVSAQKAISE